MEEEALLLLKEKGDAVIERRGGLMTWNEFKNEVKKVGYVAGPMMIVHVTQYLMLEVISLMMVGHISELAFASTSIAASLASVTGFTLLLGMVGALETLCGQAFGAKQYQMLGVYTCSATISLILVCLPISLIWLNMKKLLICIGQVPLISNEVGKYAMWLIPALFEFALLQALERYLLSQGLISVMLLSSIVVLGFHIPISWLLVFKTRLGNTGAALAIGSSYWLNVIILLLYVKYSSSCKTAPITISMEAFTSIGQYFRLALPSTVMVCFEYWSFELLILLSGILPNPQLETSVLSVCLTTISFLYTIPHGLGAAESTRISNELGAQNPQAARMVVHIAMFLAVTEATITSKSLFATRYFWGYAYSNEKEVIDYVIQMAPLVCISVIMDSLQGVMSGIARGCGRQHLAAYVNLGAFYLVGVPTAVVLGFVLHLEGKGLWIGIMLGVFVQTILLSILTCGTNWEQQAIKAKERTSSKGNEADDESR